MREILNVGFREVLQNAQQTLFNDVFEIIFNLVMCLSMLQKFILIFCFGFDVSVVLKENLSTYYA